MRKWNKQRIAIALIGALLAGILPSGQGKESQAAEETEVSAVVEEAQTSDTAAKYNLQNPRIDSDGNTTWDCVYFGNYWQNDTNGDGKVNKNDEKEPIKWRVLSVDGDDAFLLADQSLECEIYDANSDFDVTWESCLIRSWLNGLCGDDYDYTGQYTGENDSFISNAFISSEQEAIKNTIVTNADNPEYGTEGGNDTTDKVYLLSIEEATNSAYGFSSQISVSKTRGVKNTAYAKKRGASTSTFIDYAGNGYWWLRTPGNAGNYASHVCYNGEVSKSGFPVGAAGVAICPALHLNLSSTSVWSYAGTVSSDGTVTEPTEPVATTVPTKYNLKNPRNDSDGNTTWDCVYFGNYWQNDTNGDGKVNKNDEKEPIKWRVLSVDGDDAFLLADQSVECEVYGAEDVTWKNCMMRSWLNGLCENEYDFTGENDSFISNAFTSSEKEAIKNTTVINKDNPVWGTEGGDDTTDKVYLLSIEEVTNSTYGFSVETSASKTRGAKNTAYVKARAEFTSQKPETEGNGYWWLRTPGQTGDYASYVNYGGGVSREGFPIYNTYNAIRPALHLNLSSTSVWSYAGAVSSDGTVTEPETPKPEPTEEPSAEPLPVTTPVPTPTEPPTPEIQESLKPTQTTIPTTTPETSKPDKTEEPTQTPAISEGTPAPGVQVSQKPTQTATPINTSAPTQSVQENDKLPQQIQAESITKPYGSKPFSLEASTTGDGALSYASSSSKVAEVSADGIVTVKGYGKTVITIQASETGNYLAAEQKITLTVVPKQMKLKKAKSMSRREIYLSWKKDKSVTGYEIQISLRKNFKKKVTQYTCKKKKKSTLIDGLKSKKTYYVRIRAYRKVGKVKYYGAWSKSRTVKIK